MTRTVVGAISDTHGLLRPEAVAAFAGVHHILHAGDIGDAAVLDALAAIAPVTAVRGNNDVGAWARALPEQTIAAFGRLRVLVTHERSALDAAELAATGVRLVVTGHSHRPAIERLDTVLYLNPGSAGPRRFTLPVTAARIVIDSEQIAAEIVPLLPATPPSRRT